LFSNLGLCVDCSIVFRLMGLTSYASAVDLEGADLVNGVRDALDMLLSKSLIVHRQVWYCYVENSLKCDLRSCCVLMNLQQHFTLTALVRHFAVAKLHEAKDNTIELHTKFINHCAALVCFNDVTDRNYFSNIPYIHRLFKSNFNELFIWRISSYIMFGLFICLFVIMYFVLWPQGTTFSILSICEHLRVLAFEHHVQSAGMLFFTLFRSVLLHFDLLDSVPCRQLAGMEPNWTYIEFHTVPHSKQFVAFVTSFLSWSDIKFRGCIDTCTANATAKSHHLLHANLSCYGMKDTHFLVSLII